MNESRNERWRENIKFMIEIITAVLTIISLVLVWRTLQEMRIERDNAYKPEIVFNEEIEQIWIQTEIAVQNDKINVARDSEVCKIKMKNIGVGTAKDIKVNFDPAEIERCAKWIEENYIYVYFDYQKDKSQIVGLGGGNFGRDACAIENTRVNKQSILYLLPDAKDEVVVEIPKCYMLLLTQINFIDDRVPKLTFQVSWCDVQGKTYKKRFGFENITIFPTKKDEIEFTLNKWKKRTKEDKTICSAIFLKIKEIK